jgi:hypothetical protein
LVVHDCLPPNYAVASPRYLGTGEWCGVTYKAYLDFVTGRDDLEFVTVNTDYGCGIIRKRGTNNHQAVMPKERLELIRRWRSIGDDFALAFRFFEENNRDLLNLVSLGDFIEQHRGRPMAMAACHLEGEFILDPRNLSYSVDLNYQGLAPGPNVVR